jgi:hypothetical protein
MRWHGHHKFKVHLTSYVLHKTSHLRLGLSHRHDPLENMATVVAEAKKNTVQFKHVIGNQNGAHRLSGGIWSWLTGMV